MKNRLLRFIKWNILIYLIVIYSAIINNYNFYSNKYMCTEKIIVKSLSASRVDYKNKNDDSIESLRKKYNNNDVYGSLYIKGTNIDDVLPKGNDNSYYLNHDLDGNYDSKGTLFLDYRVSESTRKILIYGHTSVDLDTKFNELENYYDYDFYKNHKYINLNINNKRRIYEIFSVYVEVKDWRYMNLNFKDDNDYINHLKLLKSKSMYDTKVDVSNDKILILQACSRKKEYAKYKDKYLLVIAKEKTSS